MCGNSVSIPIASNLFFKDPTRRKIYHFDHFDCKVGNTARKKNGYVGSLLCNKKVLVNSFFQYFKTLVCTCVDPLEILANPVTQMPTMGVVLELRNILRQRGNQIWHLLLLNFKLRKRGLTVKQNTMKELS